MLLMHRSPDHTPNRTVLLATPDASGLQLVRVRRRDRLLARWRAQALDEQLAAGRGAEDDRLRAVRAGDLAGSAERRRLAGFWEATLARAAQAHYPADPRVPLRRSALLAAEDDVRHMIGLLRAPLPVPARGVAMANLLLTSGAGPLYNARSKVDLRARVRDAIRHLDPLTGLPASIS